MDLDKIINIVGNFIIQDWILMWIILVFWIISSILKTNNIFKFYYWTLTWLIVFLLFNLWLNNINDNDLYLLNWFRDSLVDLRSIILFLSLSSIIYLPIFFLSDYSVNFKQPNNKILNSLYAFILGVFYPIFLISILLSIVDNKLIFWIDPIFIESLQNFWLLQWVITYFSFSFTFNLLNEYSYLISFIFLLILFYKLTLSWFIFYLFWNLFKKGIIKDKSKLSDDNNHE